MKKLTLCEFIERAKNTHNNKYDYSKSVYVNGTIPTKIICPNHGEFWQKPSNHLIGYGCPYCGGTKKLTTEEFVEKAKLKYGNKYDYSKVEYHDNKTKVCIICYKHGEFWQRPNDHLSGYECPYCGGTKKLTTEEFIKRSIQVHGNKYDYSKVEYINAVSPVIIICPKHGEYKQIAGYHLDGNGCPECNESWGEKEIRKFFEKNNIVFERQKRFDSCKNKRPLPFDFYLPDYNLCIEFQGRQHFEPVKDYGGEEEFLKVQINDKIKKDWCLLDTNPNLIEITFKDDVNRILEEKLSGYKKSE